MPEIRLTVDRELVKKDAYFLIHDQLVKADEAFWERMQQGTRRSAEMRLKIPESRCKVNYQAGGRFITERGETRNVAFKQNIEGEWIMGRPNYEYFQAGEKQFISFSKIDSFDYHEEEITPELTLMGVKKMEFFVVVGETRYQIYKEEQVKHVFRNLFPGDGCYAHGDEICDIIKKMWSYLEYLEKLEHKQKEDAKKLT